MHGTCTCTYTCTARARGRVNAVHTKRVHMQCVCCARRPRARHLAAVVAPHRAAVRAEAAHHALQQAQDLLHRRRGRHVGRRPRLHRRWWDDGRRRRLVGQRLVGRRQRHHLQEARIVRHDRHDRHRQHLRRGLERRHGRPAVERLEHRRLDHVLTVALPPEIGLWQGPKRHGLHGPRRRHGRHGQPVPAEPPQQHEAANQQ